MKIASDIYDIFLRLGGVDASLLVVINQRPSRHMNLAGFLEFWLLTRENEKHFKPNLYLLRANWQRRSKVRNGTEMTSTNS